MARPAHVGVLLLTTIFWCTGVTLPASGKGPPPAPMVYVGAIRGAYQLAEPWRSEHLRASDRVGLMLTTLGLSHLMFTKIEDWHGSLRAAHDTTALFSKTTGGILEGNIDRQTCSSVPRSADNFSRPDDWADWIKTIGWFPDTFLLNINSVASKEQLYSPEDTNHALICASDIRRDHPFIHEVYPYLSPNAGLYPSWSTSPYWEQARKMAEAMRGYAVDVPVGYFLTMPQAYRDVVADEIRWGIARHLMVFVLLSPYSTDTADCTVLGICQFSRDPHFLASTQAVFKILSGAGASPSAWIVDNYSEQSVSPYPGLDDPHVRGYDPNTILAVASFLLDASSGANEKTQPRRSEE